MADSDKKILGAFTLALLLCVYGPTVIFWTFRLLKYGNYTYVAKRHLGITLVAIGCSSAHILIDRPLFVLYYSKIWEHAIWANMLTYSIVLYASLYSLLFRFWILHYDINATHYISNNEWKEIINPSSNEGNWYLRNMDTWGNPSFGFSLRHCRFNGKGCGWRFFVAYICAGVVSGFIWTLSYQDVISYGSAAAIDSINVLFPCVAMGYVWWKTSDFYDSFGIRSEMKLIFINFAVLIVPSYVMWTIASQSMQKNAFYANIADTHLAMLGHFLNCLIMTLHVVVSVDPQLAKLKVRTRKSSDKPGSVNHSAEKDLSNHIAIHLSPKNGTSASNTTSVSPAGRHNSLQLMTPSPMSDEPSFTRIDTTKKIEQLQPVSMTALVQNTPGKLRPQHVMAYDRTFEVFMTFLCKEFSQECLLSYVEMQQYQNLLLTTVLDNDSERGSMQNKLDPPTFPSEVPLSAIVVNADLTLKEKMLALYAKYIRSGATYEINIGYGLHESIVAQVEKPRFLRIERNYSDNIWSTESEMSVSECKRMFNLLQRCKYEMNRLLNDCFIRFRHDPFYADIIERPNEYFVAVTP